jgi:ABC-type transport system involved in multi-copper enzyme maturation permease subunit
LKTLLRAEVLKLRTTRTFVALVAASLALSLLVVVLAAVLIDQPTSDDVHDLFTSDFSGLFILLLGVTGMAGEWRHRTITGTVLAAPDRVRLLGAKIFSYALAGAVLSLVVTVTIMAIGTIILAARDETTIGLATMADVLWRNLVVAAFFGAFGVVVGALVRNQVVAVVGLLVLALAIEPAVYALADGVAKFFPTSGAPNAVTNTSFDDSEQLPAGLAVLVLSGWIALGFVAGAITLRKRDLV